MNLPARDETNRLEMAQQRLADAMTRLEGALAKPVAPVPDSASEEVGKLSALHEEIKSLTQDNESLEQANSAALNKIQDTITRLKSALEA